MEKFIKQPWEKFPIAGDFSKVLGDEETIDSGASTVIAYNSAGEDVTEDIIDNISFTDSRIIAKLKGGNDGENYKITFKAHTSQDNDYELDVMMICKVI